MVAITSSRITTNHDAIRRWAEERGAKPAVRSAGDDGDPGTVRLEFPGSRDTSLREIGWDEWFQKLDKSKLALLYQEQTADGGRSNFCKIVRCEKADEVESALGGRGRSAARRGSPRAEVSARRNASASEKSPEAEEDSPTTDAESINGKPGRARKAEPTRSAGKKSGARRKRPNPDAQPAPAAMERTNVMEPEKQVDPMRMRSDEDPPIPIPPGEEPPPPVKEPPDTPVIAPDSPVREPGPSEPRRL